MAFKIYLRFRLSFCFEIKSHKDAHKSVIKNKKQGFLFTFISSAQFPKENKTNNKTKKFSFKGQPISVHMRKRKKLIVTY